MILRKRISLLLVAIIIMIGACGCMNHQDYADKILAELENKYNKSFEIVKLSYEIDGENGNFYRAVCREQGGNTTFVAFYYLKGSDYLLSDELEEDFSTADEPILIDSYSNSLLNKAYVSFLEENADILFAISDVNFISHSLSKEDVDQGLAYCLFDGRFEAISKVYLFADQAREDKEQFESELLQWLSDYKILQQSIDIAYIPAKDIEAVRDEYQDDTYLIREKLKNDSRVSRYSWYLTEAGNGIVSKNDVKGV